MLKAAQLEMMHFPQHCRNTEVMVKVLADLGDNLDIVLREAIFDREVLELTKANLGRLRAWEAWAQGEITSESIANYRALQIQAWEAKTAIPGLIRRNGHVIGSIAATINTYAKTAEIGFWIDADHEGEGIVSKAAQALIDLIFRNGDIVRIEIRTSVGNQRSRAVAERLGFALEGVLRQALNVGAEQHDAAVYGLIAGE